MSKRFINTNIWEKPEFEDISQNQKLLFFFVITRCDNIGILNISQRMISFQVGFEVSEADILSLPLDIEKVDDNVFWISKFCFHQYGELKESCPPHRRYLNDLKNRGLLERVLKGYSKGIETLEEKDKEKEEDKDKDKDKDKPKKKFKKPTIEEVREYCSERGNKINPQYFIDSNEAKGWVVGKNKTPMKDWKATIRLWELNQNDNSQTPKKTYREVK